MTSSTLQQRLGAAPVRRVIVAGGGLVGLTLAIALRRTGADVMVCEQAPEVRAAGASIGLWSNALAVFDDVKAQRKQIMRITTDSRPMEEPKNPEGDVLFDLYKLVATEAQIADMTALYARGGFGYGEVKKALADAAEAYFAAARERRADWAARPDDVRDVLKAGAAKARAKAAATLARAQAACGAKGY